MAALLGRPLSPSPFDLQWIFDIDSPEFNAIVAAVSAPMDGTDYRAPFCRDGAMSQSSSTGA